MTAKKQIIIAIDGYSSCGKSTFAKAIAAMLGYAFIDTGAMYRAVTLWTMRNNVPANEIEKQLNKIHITFKSNDSLGRSEIFLNSENIDSEIRNMEVSNRVSSVAAIAALREKLVAMQQEMGSQGGVVMDGRDIGTVVFPKAQLKIFMTASVDVRAQRRYDELKAKGEIVSLEEIKQNVAQRDHQDETRDQSPLKQAHDAIVLDNSNMTVDQQMEWVRNILHNLDVI